MSRPAWAINQTASLAAAIRLMASHRVSGVPVVDDDHRVVGMLTEGDLLRRVEIGAPGRGNWLARFLCPEADAARYVISHGRCVGDVMTRAPVHVTETTLLQTVVDLMQQHRVRRLPVVRDDVLVGVVSRADLVRRVGDALTAPTQHAGDAQILAAMRRAVDEAAWSPNHMIRAHVRDGVVSLHGCAFALQEREAAGLMAARIIGVREVVNRIICVEPHTGLVMYDPDRDEDATRAAAREPR